MNQFLILLLVLQDVLCALMGLSENQRRLIAGTEAAKTVSFQAIAITGVAIAFAINARSLEIQIGKSPFDATLVAIAASLGLWLLERFTLMQLRSNPQFKGANTVRWLTLVIVLLSALFELTESFKDDIAVLNAKERPAKEAALRNDPRYKTILENKQTYLSTITVNVKRLSEIDREITRKEEIIAEHQRQHDLFCTAGGFVEGVNYGEAKCGKGAGIEQGKITSNTAALIALYKEKAALGGADQKYADAEKSLKEVNQSIKEELDQGENAVSSKVNAILKLLVTDVGALLPLVFWMAIYLLFDFMAFRSYRVGSNVERQFKEMADLENRLVQAKIQQQAYTYKQELADIEKRPMSVSITPMKIASTPKNDRKSKANAGGKDQ